MSGYMLRVAPNRGVACCAAVKKTAAEVLEMKERRRAREALKEERKRQQARETAVHATCEHARWQHGDMQRCTNQLRTT